EILGGDVAACVKAEMLLQPFAFPRGRLEGDYFAGGTDFSGSQQRIKAVVSADIQKDHPRLNKFLDEGEFRTFEGSQEQLGVQRTAPSQPPAAEREANGKGNSGKQGLDTKGDCSVLDARRAREKGAEPAAQRDFGCWTSSFGNRFHSFFAVWAPNILPEGPTSRRVWVKERADARIRRSLALLAGG